jgi:hypothetical protein
MAKRLSGGLEQALVLPKKDNVLGQHAQRGKPEQDANHPA